MSTNWRKFREKHRNGWEAGGFICKKVVKELSALASAKGPGGWGGEQAGI